jgi:hypothetical protein
VQLDLTAQNDRMTPSARQQKLTASAKLSARFLPRWLSEVLLQIQDGRVRSGTRTAMRNGLDVRGSILGSGKGLRPLHSVQTGSGARWDLSQVESGE